MNRYLRLFVFHIVIALGALISPPAIAQQAEPGSANERDLRMTSPEWAPGERLPPEVRQRTEVVGDWRRHNLPPPQRNHRWLCDPSRACFLVDDDGIVRRTLRRGAWRSRWRDRYGRRFTYRDDVFYRECRTGADPAEILLGGIIGDLPPRRAARDEAGVAGVIVGTRDAAVTQALACPDRSHAYAAYYEALNGGRPGVIHRWHNPITGRHGRFRVRSYYYDKDGFRRAYYGNVAFLPSRLESTGVVCRQPNGAWVFLS